jgi:hypothetical protein
MGTVMTVLKSRSTPVVALSACVLACSSEPADIGSDRPPGTPQGLAGSWDGYTEAFELEPGSSRLRLVLDAAGRGTLLFGETLLAPPDARIGYPPTLPPPRYDDSFCAGALRQWMSAVVAGFRYPLHDTQVDDGRIRFALHPSDHFVDWCRLQTPVLRSAEEYSCVINGPTLGGVPIEGCPTDCCIGVSDQATFEAVDCLRHDLCRRDACTCTVEGCEATPGPAKERLSFDAVVDATGSELSGALGNGHRIFLRRD